jgi:hypothetical protein
MIYIVTGISIFVASAIAYNVFGKSKKEEAPQIKKIGAETLAETEKEIPLGASIYIIDDIYKVVERAKYCEIEEGEDESQTEILEDDCWWVLSLQDAVSDKVYFLSCEQDDEDRWEFWFYEGITTKIKEIEAFANVSYDGDEGLPPKKFQYLGSTYKAVKGDFDETYHVSSHRVDRKSVSEYFVQSTEYKQYPSDGSKGTQMISFELWDGGMSASIGKKVDNVEVIPE